MRKSARLPDVEPIFRHLGLSSDYRTNRWELRLPCGHTIKPPTTMLAVNTAKCQRCDREFVVDYNNRVMKEFSYE